jgi:glucose-1-phosphate adenylyltransferase
MDETIAVILGGGEGKRLFPLTKDRSKPAVSIAGKYRLIDIPVSNCINSGIRLIYVLTMYQSASLNAHIAKTYQFDQFSSGFVGILAAEQTARGGTWFRGTADAVRQAWFHISREHTPSVLILSGDHLYRMDYGRFKEAHVKSGAAVSIAVHPVSRADASYLGIVKPDETGRIIRFAEKPGNDAQLDDMIVDTTCCGLTQEEAKKRPYLGSMGIYLFNTSVLKERLDLDPEQTDFGSHIIPDAIRDIHVQAFPFDGYWADIGTVRSFYEANMDLVMPLPKFNLFDPDMPIYTHARPLPGAKLNRASVQCAVLCEGVIVEGATVRDSILGVRSRVRPGAIIESSLIMGSDFYERRSVRRPLLGVGEGTYIRHSIIDKNASIGRGVQLVNRENVMHYDDPNEQFYVRDGIVVVVKGGVIPDGFVF